MIGDLFGRHFWIPAGLALAAGFWLPGSYAGLRVSATLLLGGILFFSCLNIRFDHLRGSLASPGLGRTVGTLTLLKLFVLPVGAWSIARVLSPAWAPAVLLVSAMPAGLTSIAFAGLTRGNQVLALLFVLLSSALCPVSVPLLIEWLGPSESSLGMRALAGRALYILGVLLVPFIGAQITRSLASAAIDRCPAVWTRAAVLCSCLLIFVSVAGNRDSWSRWEGAAFATPLALAFVAATFFAIVAWLVSKRLDAEDAIAYACGSLFMNNGLAIVLAVRFFPDDGRMVLPAVLMQIPMTLAMTVLAQIRHRERCEPVPR